MIHRLFARLGWPRAQSAVSVDPVRQGRQRALRWWAEQEGDQARCDLCGRVMGLGEGYLVEGGVVEMWGMTSCQKQTKQGVPWLLCSDCNERVLRLPNPQNHR